MNVKTLAEKIPLALEAMSNLSQESGVNLSHNLKWKEYMQANQLQNILDIDDIKIGGGPHAIDFKSLKLKIENGELKGCIFKNKASLTRPSLMP